LTEIAAAQPDPVGGVLVGGVVGGVVVGGVVEPEPGVMVMR
jgi:hypothetical protein